MITVALQHPPQSSLYSQCEQGHHHLDALVRPLLVVVLGALDGVKEAVAVIGDAFEGVVDAVVLPRVLDHQHLQQQVQVGPQLVGVGVGHLFVRIQSTLHPWY